MRPGEVMALRWSEVDTRKRSAKVRRIRIYGEIQERTKTKTSREVLLNDHALMALDKARSLTAARSDYVFAPVCKKDKSELFIRCETGPKRYWLSAMRKLGIRRLRKYDTSHTYATMCLMSGMNPAFIAAQLGHSEKLNLTESGTREKPVTPDMPKYKGLSIDVRISRRVTFRPSTGRSCRR